MLRADQINSLALTNAVFHYDGSVILMMTVVMALMNKAAPQVGTSDNKNYFFVVLFGFFVLHLATISVALREYAENLLGVL